jgi:hypothetical protein
VTSGLPQGSVLGPTLFLLYINDIAADIKSTLRLFADDSILYREIKGADDQLKLQDDLNKVFKWADQWQICFNTSKCQSLIVTRKIKPWKHIYKVADQSIDETSSHKYLGVTINKHLDWKEHVKSITSKARSTLGVLRRNLSACPTEVKARAYQALVRPKLEYAVAAWNPYTKDMVNSLESVQRQGVRFVLNIYDRTTSVSQMLHHLEWDLFIN